MDNSNISPQLVKDFASFIEFQKFRSLLHKQEGGASSSAFASFLKQNAQGQKDKLNHQAAAGGVQNSALQATQVEEPVKVAAAQKAPRKDDEDSYYCESLGNYGQGDSGSSPAKKSPLNKLASPNSVQCGEGDQNRSSKNEDALTIIDKQESIYMADKSPLQSDEHSSNLRLSAKSFRPLKPEELDENTDPDAKDLDPEAAELVSILKIVNSSREQREKIIEQIVRSPTGPEQIDRIISEIGPDLALEIAQGLCTEDSDQFIKIVTDLQNQVQLHGFKIRVEEIKKEREQLLKERKNNQMTIESLERTQHQLQFQLKETDTEMEIDRKFRSEFEKSQASNNQECKCEPPIQRSKKFNLPPQKLYNDFDLEDDRRQKPDRSEKVSEKVSEKKRLSKEFNDFRNEDSYQRQGPSYANRSSGSYRSGGSSSHHGWNGKYEARPEEEEKQSAVPSSQGDEFVDDGYDPVRIQPKKKAPAEFFEEGWVESSYHPIEEEAGEEGSHRGSRQASPVREMTNEPCHQGTDDYGEEELPPRSANNTDLRAPSSVQNESASAQSMAYLPPSSSLRDDDLPVSVADEAAVEEQPPKLSHPAPIISSESSNPEEVQPVQNKKDLPEVSEVIAVVEDNAKQSPSHDAADSMPPESPVSSAVKSVAEEVPAVSRASSSKNSKPAQTKAPPAKSAAQPKPLKKVPCNSATLSEEAEATLRQMEEAIDQCDARALRYAVYDVKTDPALSEMIDWQWYQDMAFKLADEE